MVRPVINNGKTGVGKFGVGVMPDGTSDTLRVLIKPDGFHFESYDFDDLVLSSIALQSPSGGQYVISFDDTGSLLINGVEHVMPTNNEDESIGGNKTFTGLTSLDGGLQIKSPDGTKYTILVDDAGVLTTVKGVQDDIDYK